MTRNHGILLVDDNKSDVELARRAFQRAHPTGWIAVARDGEEALDYLFATGAHTGRDSTIVPEVVLLDLKLPKLDGHQVLRRMRADERTKRIPVVVLSSSAERQDVLTSYELGANSFVRKPVDFTDFLDLARLLAAYWLVANEPVDGG
ncbi:MAG: response regulator [Polyangiaceae bacterium]|nr:response regulator [Polyangiaceae bacterium]